MSSLEKTHRREGGFNETTARILNRYVREMLLHLRTIQNRFIDPLIFKELTRIEQNV